MQSSLRGLEQFREVWAVDYEFTAPAGERPVPICLVARELRSGRQVTLWQDELQAQRLPPFGVGADVLVIAYYSSAEWGCHLALGWPLPENVLDLFVEFRNLINGRRSICGPGLLGALTFFGLDALDVVDKTEMRELAMRGGPWTQEERAALLTYCESDVVALAQLLPRMLPRIDLPRALVRGRYMKAAARMEDCGVPIDLGVLAGLTAHWPEIQVRLIKRIDVGFGVYEGRTFKRARFTEWLALSGIPWPHLASGAPALDDDTFRDMARSYPEVAPLRELRHALSQLRLTSLAVGSEGRNRCLLSAFRARTGRNQPSNSKFIFGPSVWLRGLIQPEPGYALAYVDWDQQEFGIAAALSGDPKMLAAYESGDPYMAFAVQVGAAPHGAIRETHSAVREQFKACVLAVQYGMGARSLALRIGQPEARARELLELHRKTYSGFWAWSDGVVDHAMLRSKLWTVFGWEVHIDSQTNSRSLRNFPMQANGAEMLRLACCLTTEGGIQVCAPIHDALLVTAPLAEIDEVTRQTQDLMATASRAVLGGFALRSEAKVFRYPERYMDDRGERMWKTVQELLAEIAETPSPG